MKKVQLKVDGMTCSACSSGLEKYLLGKISVFFSFCYSVFGLFQIYQGNTSYIHQLYFESVAMVIYFVKLGRFIEDLSKNKTTAMIQNLVTITPKSAMLKHGKELVSVTLYF